LGLLLLALPRKSSSSSSSASNSDVFFGSLPPARGVSTLRVLIAPPPAPVHFLLAGAEHDRGLLLVVLVVKQRVRLGFGGRHSLDRWWLFDCCVLAARHG
jgi:hypothetical protein